MSNYNWEPLKGYEDNILVGAEVVNGTGTVGLRLSNEAEPEPVYLYFDLTPEEALDFAKLLSKQAHEAMQARWNERHLLW
jgi:hypothetical protein